MPYAAALAITLVVEVPVYLLALVIGAGWSPRRAVLAAIGVNLATHPLAWLVLLEAGSPYLAWFVAVECGVWLVETGLLWLAAPRRGGRGARGADGPAGRRLVALAALVANSGSALLGVGAWWLLR